MTFESRNTPNGWGCGCRIVAVSRKEAEAQGGKFKAPTRPGDTTGIDEGWDYMPGDSRERPMQEFINKKLINLEAPIGAAMAQSLESALRLERQLAWYEILDQWRAAPFPRKQYFVVGSMSPEVLAALKKHELPSPVTAEIAVQDQLIVGAKQRRHEADQNALTAEEWRQLPELIKSAQVLWDVESKKLVYAMSAGDASKRAVVEFGFEIKKPKKTVNMIVSGFRVPAASIDAAIKGGDYKELLK